MDDITQVLRINCGHLSRHRPCFHDDAADEIERLRARLDAADRLADAAGHAVHSGVGPDSFVHRMADLTRAITEYEEARDG